MHPIVGRKRSFPAAALCAAFAFVPAQLSAQLSAQAYPHKPLRRIFPYSAGSGTDLVARVLATELPKIVGQQVLVEKRAGAATIRLRPTSQPMRFMPSGSNASFEG